MKFVMARVLVIIAEWYNSFAVMRAFFANKFWIIVLSVLALGALTVLATGMRSMSFREGQAFGRNEPAASRANPVDLIRTFLEVPLPTQLIFWALVAAMIVLIAVLVSPEARKRLLRMLFRAAVTYWALYWLFTRYPQVLARIGMAFSPSRAGPIGAGEAVAPPEFTPPPSNSWLAYLASFGIAILVAFVGWRLYRVWRVLHGSASDQPVQTLARIARTSLQDLSSGRDSTDVILNCYFRMSDVVSEKRNLSRRDSMTPHEFATRLEQAGLPGDPVQQLTRLFEAVRYGGQRSSPVMIKEAVACLTAILYSCGETV